MVSWWMQGLMQEVQGCPGAWVVGKWLGKVVDSCRESGKGSAWEGALLRAEDYDDHAIPDKPTMEL